MYMALRYSQAQWEEMIAEYKASGISAEKWCSKKGITKSVLYKWMSRISKTKASASEPLWVEIAAPEVFSDISLKYKEISIDIKQGYNKSLLADVLKVVMNL